MDSVALKKEINYKGNLFSKHFIDSKSLFLFHFHRLPSITIVRQVDHEKIWRMLQVEFGDHIVEQYHYTAVSKKKATEEKEESILLMDEALVIEIGDGYCEFYFSDAKHLLLQKIINRVVALRGTPRSKPQEINLITHGDYGLELTKMDVKRSRLNLDLYYEDDFLPVHQTILRRLNKKDDKGIVLLHGLPGTGKTTYLRYLIGKVKKRVLFIPPDLASQIANPELVRLLVDNPNCVLVIEDAETLLMQRQSGQDSAVSNLLNISDGLLSDFLNVQIVCTFNNHASLVDTAIIRKGRLIASYDFHKLSVKKSQQLSRHLGYHSLITTPMTVSEIVNQKEQNFSASHERPLIGFRASKSVVKAV